MQIARAGESRGHGLLPSRCLSRAWGCARPPSPSVAIYWRSAATASIQRSGWSRVAVRTAEVEVNADIMSFEIPEPYVWDESFRVMVSTLVLANIQIFYLCVNIVWVHYVRIYGCMLIIVVISSNFCDVRLLSATSWVLSVYCWRQSRWCT